MKSLFAVVEAYPDLQASENFMQLQQSLEQTEDAIQRARHYYNAVVRDYNMSIEVFPRSYVASLFGFHKRPFFSLTDEAEMMRIRRTLIIACLLLISLTFAATAELRIQDFAVDILADPSGQLLVTENITVRFSTPHHGIERFITISGKTPWARPSRLISSLKRSSWTIAPFPIRQV